MADQWRTNAFRIEMGNMPVGAGMWISRLSIPKLDASTGDRARTGMWISRLSLPKLDASTDPGGQVSLRIPLDLARQVSTAESQLRSISAVTYEASVVERVTTIDGMTHKRSLKEPGETEVSGLLLLGFEPSRTGARFIKSRSGHLFDLDDSGAAGRLTASVGRRTRASWRFDRGWLFALDRTRMAPGSPGNVLFVPEALRRG